MELEWISNLSEKIKRNLIVLWFENLIILWSDNLIILIRCQLNIAN